MLTLCPEVLSSLAGLGAGTSTQAPQATTLGASSLLAVELIVDGPTWGWEEAPFLRCHRSSLGCPICRAVAKVMKTRWPHPLQLFPSTLGGASVLSTGCVELNKNWPCPRLRPQKQVT